MFYELTWGNHSKPKYREAESGTCAQEGGGQTPLGSGWTGQSRAAQTSRWSLFLQIDHFRPENTFYSVLGFPRCSLSSKCSSLYRIWVELGPPFARTKMKPPKYLVGELCVQWTKINCQRKSQKHLLTYSLNTFWWKYEYLIYTRHVQGYMDTTKWTSIFVLMKSALQWRSTVINKKNTRVIDVNDAF